MLHPEKYNFLLASQSPRRQRLLGELGIAFQVVRVEHDEHFPADMDPGDVAGYLAKEKSLAYADLGEGQLLITADTVVILDGAIINKPEDEEDAVRMIRRLSGKIHRVDTGVCMRTVSREIVFTDSTEVMFRELEDSEIRHYVEKFRPMDKAGAYGIQEWIGYIGVERIDGCFYNVMGLPVSKLYAALKEF